MRTPGSEDRSAQQTWLAVGLLLLGIYLAAIAIASIAAEVALFAVAEQAQLPLESSAPRIAAAAVQMRLGAGLASFARPISRALSRAA